MSSPDLKHGRLSRREFLKIAAAGAGGLVAAGGVGALIRRAIEAGAPPAGGPDRLPGATATAPATATKPATATLEASPTPDFPVLLNGEVTPYATALGLSAQEVTGRVTQSEYRDLTGDRFTVALDPTTSIPLLVTNKEGRWQRASLRSLADKSGINMGVLFDDRARFPLGTEFNYGLISSGWRWTIQSDNRRDVFNFSDEDGRIRTARQQGINNFRLMHLTVGSISEVPLWLQEGNFSRTELIDILTGYITRVMTHFKGVIGEYVVVNEPFRQGDLFNQVIGPEYIDIAFQAARDADPTAILVFNEVDNQRSGGYSTSWTREIVTRLKSKGLIDKVGLQMHLQPDAIGVPSDIIRIITGYGLPACVTEFDYNIRDLRGTPLERFTQQAQVYESVLGAAVTAGVKDLGFWGYGDALSWLESSDPDFPNTSPAADPTMWDGDGNPKPAYYAVRKVLLAAAGA